jgi:hypothetical protein
MEYTVAKPINAGIKTNARKTTCPVTRAEFSEHAHPLGVLIGAARSPEGIVSGGTELSADPRTFSSGSLGFYMSGKVTVTINGKRVILQVGGNLVVVGSKELPGAGSVDPETGETL